MILEFLLVFLFILAPILFYFGSNKHKLMEGMVYQKSIKDHGFLFDPHMKYAEYRIFIKLENNKKVVITSYSKDFYDKVMINKSIYFYNNDINKKLTKVLNK